MDDNNYLEALAESSVRDELLKALAESSVRYELLKAVCAIYVSEPSIYSYTYENSEVFRNFMDHISDEWRQFFKAARGYKRVRRFRSGLYMAGMMPLLAPVAIVKGIKKAKAKNAIKATVGTKEFNEVFSWLSKKTIEETIAEYAVNLSFYESMILLEENCNG